MKALIGSDARIVGFTMIGSEAGEVMTTVQTAMLADLPYQRLRDAVIAHLTVAEVWDRSSPMCRLRRNRARIRLNEIVVPAKAGTRGE